MSYFNSHILQPVNQQIKTLEHLLLKIEPPSAEAFYTDEGLKILNVIQEFKSHLSKRVEKEECEIERFKQAIGVLSLPLGNTHLSTSPFKNLYNEKSYYNLLLYKYKIQYRKLSVEILKVEKEIKYLKKVLNIEYEDREWPITSQVKDDLIGERSKLSEVLKERERKRIAHIKKIERYYEEISDLIENNFKVLEILNEKENDVSIKSKLYLDLPQSKSKRLKKNRKWPSKSFLQNMTIFELETLSQELSNMSSLRSLVFNILRSKVTYYSSLLQDTTTCNPLLSNNINTVYKKYILLVKEHKKIFNTIFDNTFNDYVGLCKLFELPVEKIPRSDDALKTMRENIEHLLPRRGLYIQLVEKIAEREELNEEINIFEESKANDPHRFSKSSINFVREEKFRKRSMVKLMALENEIFKLIYEYEERFKERFLLKKKEYKSRLKREVAKRGSTPAYFTNKK